MVFLLLTAAACQSGTDAAPTPTPAAARANSAPGKPVAGEVELHPAAEPTSADVTHWQCDDILLDLREEGDTARIDFSGRSLTLQHGESLVGARYSDAKSNAFTRDGDHATLALPGESHACTLTDTVSPWNSAAARGVTFRAVGNEPGWWVEISGGTRPALHAVLDYGDRLIDAPELVATRGRFSGRTSEGAVVVLTVERGECRGGMSGAAFEASATLATGSQVYRGCGAFLDD